MRGVTAGIAARQSGFTLLELLLALTLFAMLSVIGYQAIADVARAKGQIQSQVETQTQRRLAYRALQSAMSSGAEISGTRLDLRLLFSGQESNWPDSVTSAHIVLDSAGQLLSSLGPKGETTILMTGLEGAEFRYIKGGVEHSSLDSASGQQSDSPVQLIFSWRQAGAVEQWRFSMR